MTIYHTAYHSQAPENMVWSVCVVVVVSSRNLSSQKGTYHLALALPVAALTTLTTPSYWRWKYCGNRAAHAYHNQVAVENHNNV